MGNQDVMGPAEEEVAERAGAETLRCQVGKLSRQPSRREPQSAGQSSARVLTVSGSLGPEPIRSGSGWLGCASRFSCQTGVLSRLLVTQTLVRPEETESVCGAKSSDPSLLGFAELSSYCTRTRSAPARSKQLLRWQQSVVCPSH